MKVGISVLWPTLYRPNHRSVLLYIDEISRLLEHWYQVPCV